VPARRVDLLDGQFRRDPHGGSSRFGEWAREANPDRRFAAAGCQQQGEAQDTQRARG
jgi:hypothetical protein